MTQANAAAIDALLAAMTLDEKLMLTAGADLWHSVAIPRLNIPSFKLSDGPNGVRGDGATRDATSLNFPVGSTLGASFNPELLSAVGDALGQECEDKDVQLLLGPTVNIQRIPNAGRNFECYSEDPFLSSELAVAFVRGVQQHRARCCIKHFVANDSEQERMSVSSDVGERALREVYLVPFEAAVKRAQVGAIMSAYNRVNGEHASASRRLLTQILRDEWGFAGAVVSDWFGTYSSLPTAAAGLDLEMPGPARFMGLKLKPYLDSGELSADMIDAKVRRLLTLSREVGRLERVDYPQEASVDRPDARQLARRAVHEGAVLLKNEGVLPLRDTVSIALLGPSASAPQYQGGGSSAVRAHRYSDPLSALQTRFGADSVQLCAGCSHDRYLPPLNTRWLRVNANSDELGWMMAFFANDAFAGEPVHQRTSRRSDFMWLGKVAPEVPAQFSLELTSALRVDQSGDYEFALMNSGRAELFVDDRLVVAVDRVEHPGDTYLGMGSEERRSSMRLEADRRYLLRVRFRTHPGAAITGLRIGLARQQPDNGLAQAVALAQRASAAVILVGLTSDWESEGFDRRDLSLPGPQVELIQRVAAVNPKTIVVINAGSAIALGEWINQVAAVLQIGFPGQAFGEALADILSGDVSPSGRLPFTVPNSLIEAPAASSWPPVNGRLEYVEGIHVGYRGYFKAGLRPAFPFGFGLTYGRFEYESGTVASTADGWRVTCAIRNLGSQQASEVVQLYLSALDNKVDRAHLELKAFAKVAVDPGETKQVVLDLPKQSLRYYDVQHREWRVEPGRYRFSIGPHCLDLRIRYQVGVEHAQ